MGAKVVIATTFLVLLLLPQLQVYGQQQACAKTNEESCDPFQGNWVYDDSYPPYHTSSCSSMVFAFSGSTEFDCQANGRPDKDYLKYRWQPTGCDLPRFDARDFLSRFRGKNIAFVGGYLGYNQWQALICRLSAAFPRDSLSSSLVNYPNGGYESLYFQDYDVRIMFYPSPFLVNLVSHPNKGRVLQLDSIDETAFTSPPHTQWEPQLPPWKSIDVLIFNSWYSWQNTATNKQWDIIVEGDNIMAEMDPLVAYEKGLTTWANWIDANIDPSTTKVFFLGISPDHRNLDNGGSCLGETRPATEAKSSETVVSGQRVVEKVIDRMSNPVYLLNITSLSQQRPDAHPSNYNDPQGIQQTDCVNWCIYGVPDTWNQLLYAFLLQSFQN